jgi:uncharacterized protein
MCEDRPMKLVLVLACVMAPIGCGNKQAPGAGSGSGTGSATATTTGSATATPAKPADLPRHDAPPTAEVLAKFDAACDAKTATACFDSGMRRAKGMGTARDRVAAVPWLEKGCKLDDAESCGLLAGFLGTGDEGVPKDAKRAFELHQKACPRRPASCSVLANYYGAGEVVPKDEAKAMALLEQGCNAGDGGGCEDLASRLAKGDAIAKDEKRAVEVAHKACDTDAYDCTTLGILYYQGIGVAKDAGQAKLYVGKACKAGSQKGCKALAALAGH